MIEKIEKDGSLIAIILRGSYEGKDTEFITDMENPLQVGVLNHPKGGEIKPHVHKALLRSISLTQEVLHIERGVVEISFYDDSGAYIGSYVLNRDDTVILISGGHGLKMLQDAKILEVKQGPYLGVDEDKSLLEAGQKETP